MNGVFHGILSRLSLPAILAVVLAGRVNQSAAVAGPPGPLRTCVLITGERFHGELLRADRTAVEFLWQGKTRFRVPTAAVAALENPPGVVDVVDFQPSEMNPMRIEVTPISAGIAHWTPIPNDHSESEWTFEDEPLTIKVDAEGVLNAKLPADWTADFRQRLHPLPDTASVTILWSDTTWDVRVGSALWMRGSKPPSTLRQLTIVGERVIIRRFSADFSPGSQHIMTGPHDAVMRADGDVWLGEFLRTTADGIELRGQQTAVALVPWSEFTSLHLRPRSSGVDLLRPVTGRVCEFVGPEAWDPYRLPRERWIGAETVVPFPASAVDHPLLGRFWSAALADSERKPLGTRSWLWLHPQPVHLGDNLANEFRQTIPQGTQLSGVVTLPALPMGPMAVILDAVGLEPCGPQTPPTQPFLNELQAGRLRTELTINGISVGCWNEQLSYRPPPGRPARLRLAIPAHCWRVGRNEWLIRQQSSGVIQEEYDDCEISRVAIVEE